MKRSVDHGSESQHQDLIVPLAPGQASGTVDYIPPERRSESGDSLEDASAGQNDQTVISQRPVAAPEEFYRSMPLSELAAMLEGRQLDHFQVEQMIGGGGMGAVFRGRDLRLDRVVAIKVIPAARRDLETLRRFRLEAQAAAKLDHPNIARVYYVGESEQWNYIVFEFIDGVNIRDLVEMEGPLAIDDAVFYARQVAEALQHAHERDVVHRDIKPSNVLVTATGAAKVVDMGLARNTALDKSTADATASGVTLGTFDYISPEQARNPRDADVRSDLYSLGCTLFYMLTGHPPFPEGTALQKLLSHGSQPPPDPRAWREDLSDELYQITMKLMAKRPADRYQKPAELIGDLVLLAEVEDLPRSQSPGTLLVSPSIAQRSLLETNLPWMVAMAFLLGSTLWLQTVQTLSNDFALSELDYQTRRAADSQVPPAVIPSSEPTGGPAVGGTPAVSIPQSSPSNTGLPAAEPNVSSDASRAERSTVSSLSANLPRVPVGLPDANVDAAAYSSPPTSDAARLIVSTQRPADVASSQWEGDLASAIGRAKDQPGIREIELRGRLQVTTAVLVEAGELLLLGSQAEPATLEITRQPNMALPQTSVLELRDSQLRLQRIAIEVDLPPTWTSRKSLFCLHGNSQLDLDNCAITIADAQSVDTGGDQFCVISVGETDTVMPPSTAAPAGDASILIRLVNSVVRGEATFMGLRVQQANLHDRWDVSLSNTLIAVTGNVLRMRAPTGDAQFQRFARLLCSQSTFVSQQPFAKLEYDGAASPLLGLIRTSQSCIYWSQADKPHFEIYGARRQSLLGNFNLLVLQGTNNLYDANIDEICRCYWEGERIATFGFAEASTSGWLAERGNESRIRWRNSGVPPMPLREAQALDFAVADVLFVPGISPAELPGAEF